MRQQLCFIGLLLALSCLVPASAAETPQTLVGRLVAPSTVYEEQKDIAARLVRMGNVAVKPLVDACEDERTNDGTKILVIDALGKIGTSQAVDAIKRIMGFAWYLDEDILNYNKFIRVLNEGVTKKSSVALKMWEYIPFAYRQEVKDIAEGKRKPVELDHVRMVENLNAFLEAMPVFTEAELAVVNLPDAFKAKLFSLSQKLAKEEKGRGRLVVLNRIILAAAFPGMLKSLPPAGKARNLEDAVMGSAIGALKKANSPRVKDMIIALRPRGFVARKAHIAALQDIAGDKATNKLVNYLKADEGGVSGAASRALVYRFANVSSSIWPVRNLVSEIMGEEARGAKKHLYKYLADVCVGVTRADYGEALRGCLGSDSANLRKAAIMAMYAKPDLLGVNAVRTGMKEFYDMEKSNPDNIGAYLNVLARAATPECRELAALCLDNNSRKVRVAATKALQKITGQKLGKNPAVWKKWLEKEAR